MEKEGPLVKEKVPRKSYTWVDEPTGATWVVEKNPSSYTVSVNGMVAHYCTGIGKRLFELADMVEERYDEGQCPECGALLWAKYSGVVCSKCSWSETWREMND